MVTSQKLARLATEHARYIGSLKAAGKRILSYDTPCCGKSIETLAPPRGRTFDTLSLCPHCGAMHYKVVTFKKAAGYVPATSGAVH